MTICVSARDLTINDVIIRDLGAGVQHRVLEVHFPPSSSPSCNVVGDIITGFGDSKYRIPLDPNYRLFIIRNRDPRIHWVSDDNLLAVIRGVNFPRAGICASFSYGYIYNAIRHDASAYSLQPAFPENESIRNAFFMVKHSDCIWSGDTTNPSTADYPHKCPLCGEKAYIGGGMHVDHMPGHGINCQAK
jgi:hypothetical protein